MERVCLVQVASAMPLGGVSGVCAPQLPLLTGEESWGAYPASVRGSWVWCDGGQRRVLPSLTYSANRRCHKELRSSKASHRA